MRVLLDTNVLVRAITRPQGPAGELLRRLIGPRHTLVIPSAILVELHRVLNYPRVRARIQIADEQIRRVIEDIAFVAEVLDSPSAAMELSTDPDDNPILLGAAAAHVDVPCTLDHHFQQPRVVEFARRIGFRIQTDVELLQQLREESA